MVKFVVRNATTAMSEMRFGYAGKLCHIFLARGKEILDSGAANLLEL
jgi:hypothetical protein